MKATIKDVAKLAGVSIATVSRAMTGNSKVSPNKQKKIDDAIRALDYRPNVMAQHLTAQRMNNIALFPSHCAEQIMASPYISQMMIGLRQRLEQEKMEILLALENSQEQEVQKVNDLIDAGAVRGIVLLGARVQDQTIQTLSDRGFPFVVIGHPNLSQLQKTPGVNSVDTDNMGDVRDAVSRLIALGHRDIALLHAPLDYMVNRERYDGYCYALRSAGIAIHPEWVLDAGYNLESAMEASDRLLQLSHRPTAVMATDDIKALALMKKATIMGLQLPRDLSVIGHNNYEQSMLSTPTLTTVEVPMTQLAVTAADLLLSCIQDPARTPQRILLPTRFVQRESVRALD